MITTSDWTKEPPIKARRIGCATCGTLYDIAPMDMLIAVGFGDARVEKDGKCIYKEPTEYEDCDFWTVQDAENEALKDPDHDWRIIMCAPLRGRIFQRQELGKWYLISENEGFA